MVRTRMLPPTASAITPQQWLANIPNVTMKFSGYSYQGTRRAYARL